MPNYPGLSAVQKLTSACSHATGLEDIFTRAMLLNRNQNKPQEVSSQADNTPSHSYHSPCSLVETAFNSVSEIKEMTSQSAAQGKLSRGKGFLGEAAQGRPKVGRCCRTSQTPAWRDGVGLPTFSLTCGGSRGIWGTPIAYCQASSPLQLSKQLSGP